VRTGLVRLGDRLSAWWDEPAPRLLAIVVVMALALASVVLALAVPWRAPAPEVLQDPMTVRQSLSPETTLFGDAISAEIDVYTSDMRIDAGSVRVRTDFRPYRVVATQVDRSGQGQVTLLRTRITLHCLTVDCVIPRDGGRVFRFAPVTISYRRGAEELRAVDPWEPVQVYSRLTTQRPGLVDAPPTLDMQARVSPTLVRIALMVVAAVLLLAGGWLVASSLWPRFFYSRRRWRRLTPLERALAQLDAAAQVEDEDLRRRVLDQLADRLGEAELASLEQRSRTLAWRETAPEPETLALLGEQVRGSINGGLPR
jgi:hypothetical protein